MAMPELPEVESLRRILRRSAVGRTIVAAHVREPSLRRRVAADFAVEVAGRRIERLSRRAKYLIVELSGGKAILVHLGMSGSLTQRGARFALDQFDPAHDHAVFVLDDGTSLVYNDPRRFGLLRVVALGSLDELKELRALGPEPLGPGFHVEYLARKARGRTVAIKNLLMDQRIVAGVGNIYATEIVFAAGVRPARRTGRLSRAELARIVDATRQILRQAIDSRGTTFRSYRDARGRPGAFAERLKVYGREGKPCYVCGTRVRNVRLGQRASFFCPRCQR